ncbi:MAG TPA: lysylphosphatidylglycerol synthase domain-containing protein [Solirubrobacteraceae bacterium]|nr:lysylphosphatidylglycerol synthase domain-containing protein [Solirubrobacteraceae bacterium]
MISILGAAVVTGALGVVLAGRRGQFMAAIHAAPIRILSLVVLLQLVSLIARTEAWHVCVRATGATVGRRRLFRAAGVGYLASLLNGSLGVAARIAALRRTAPHDSPHVPALLAAEVPIISVEMVLAAVFSFTLIGPLGVPWWAPVIAVAVAGAAVLGLGRLSNRRRLGFWSGLAVMRSHRGRMIAFVVLAVCAQIGRNWLVLRGIGVHVSLLDAIALLIAMFTLGQFPIGPTLGPAAAVLILGSHGVAAVAAAGVLLTITATIGSLCFAGWALADRFGDRRPARSPEPVEGPEVVVTAIPA